MNIPLAERMRPKTPDEYIGQEHLMGKNGPIRMAIERGMIPSMLFWGPPGTGKTTLASLVATHLKKPFYTLSAVTSGVKEVREVIDKAKNQTLFGQGQPILFIDEIHRFNKSQQDSLLGAVEQGTITLIGATTENPSFEVNAALLSRCQTYVLQHLSKDNLILLIERALREDVILSTINIQVDEFDALLRLSGGDARRLLNALEVTVNALRGEESPLVITNKKVADILQENPALYDKTGEQHYDVISAFIKSLRGSDPNAAVYWLARMIEGGEDPKFIARRMLIMASEDIGLANPTALVMANNCFQAVTVIGYPECEIILSQTVIYLATSAKSNASYMAIKQARQFVKETGDLPVPLHLRNAPTKLMKDLDYGKSYKYSHDYPGNFADQEFLPNAIMGHVFYDPGNNPRENELRKQIEFWWKNKYQKRS